jgi:osmotically-inducible protein OsmY
MKYLFSFFSVIFLSLALLVAVGCGSTPTQEATGEYFDDSVITSKVKAAILEAPSLKTFDINVETFKGVVQLSGFVNSRADMTKAVAVAKEISGVKSVRSSMLLK